MIRDSVSSCCVLILILCPCVSLQFSSVFFPLCFPLPSCCMFVSLCLSVLSQAGQGWPIFCSSARLQSPVLFPPLSPHLFLILSLVCLCIQSLSSLLSFVSLCDVPLKVPCVSSSVYCLLYGLFVILASVLVSVDLYFAFVATLFFVPFV